MHHDIAGINEHPIALGQALDTRGTEPPFLQAACQIFRQRADMARRTAGRKHQRIRQCGASSQIDGDEVFGFVVFKRRLNAGEQRRLERGDIGDDRGSGCSQGQAPFRCSGPATAQDGHPCLIPIFGAAETVLPWNGYSSRLREYHTGGVNGERTSAMTTPQNQKI